MVGIGNNLGKERKCKGGEKERKWKTFNKMYQSKTEDITRNQE